MGVRVRLRQARPIACISSRRRSQLPTRRAPRSSGPRYCRATAADNALRGRLPCCGQLTIVTVIRIRPSVVCVCCSRGNHHPVEPEVHDRLRILEVLEEREVLASPRPTGGRAPDTAAASCPATPTATGPRPSGPRPGNHTAATRHSSSRGAQLTAPAPTRNRDSNTGRAFTHAAAANAARDGIAAFDEADVDDDAEDDDDGRGRAMTRATPRPQNSERQDHRDSADQGRRGGHSSTRHSGADYNGSEPPQPPGVSRMSGLPAPYTAHVISGMISSATMFATLIIGLIAGPVVSLNGSPTVSPVTAAA